MRFAFYTLGCKTNQYETQAMERLLTDLGHEIGHFDEKCNGHRHHPLRRCTDKQPIMKFYIVFVIYAIYSQH